MSKWTYARIDRNELAQVHCVFCNRALRSGRLIVLRDESGTEAYAGPECAKKHLGAPAEPVLDLSRMAMLLVAKGLQPSSGDPGDKLDGSKSKRAGRQAGMPLIKADEVVDYIRLRVEHMRGFSGNATQKLRDFHSQLLRDAGITSDARLYVERLLAKSKQANTIYSHRNVERCIGADYWLRVAIEHTKPDRRDFLVGMLQSLHDHWRLTSRQIEAINRWGEGVRKSFEVFPVLDVTAFEGVHAPRFAQA